MNTQSTHSNIRRTNGTLNFPKTGQIRTWEEAKRCNIQGGGFYFSDLEAWGTELHEAPRTGPDGFTYGVMSDDPPSQYAEKKSYIIQIGEDGAVNRAHNERDDETNTQALQFRTLADAFDAFDAILDGEIDPDEFAWY